MSCSGALIFKLRSHPEKYVRRCGFILTPEELQRLWLSMPITWPMESLSFAVIIKHVTQIYYSIIRPGELEVMCEYFYQFQTF